MCKSLSPSGHETILLIVMNNKELKRILDVLFTRSEHLPSLLHEIDKDTLEQCFHDILFLYATDVNSSTLRELITLLKAGYKPQPKGTKLGYNGWTLAEVPCEVKPVNVRSESNKKLNGGGNFSDFTYD